VITGHGVIGIAAERGNVADFDRPAKTADDL
jgi:hypothetical protein